MGVRSHRVRTMYRETLQLADTIRQAGTLDEAWAAMLGELHRCGFEAGKYGLAVAPTPDSRPAGEFLFVGRFDDAWEDAYAEGGCANHDYIIEHCVTRVSPLTFARVYELARRGRLPARQAQTHLMGLESGMSHGIALPLRGRHPLCRGGISLVGSPEFSREGFRRHLRHMYDRVRELAQVFDANVQGSALVGRKRQLSVRERECLLWIMRGLRTKQIAARIGTHPKTVEKQLGNVRAKLNARTNAQAAIKAMLLDLVTP